MRTREQIDQEIAKLEAFKPKVSHYTFFGDNNHAAIDAQIKVLKEQLNEDDIFTLNEEGDLTDHARDSALEAAEWLEDDKKLLADDPEGWLSIVRQSEEKQPKQPKKKKGA